MARFLSRFDFVAVVAAAVVLVPQDIVAYEHREFSALHEFSINEEALNPHGVHGEVEVHVAKIPLEFMNEMYNRSSRISSSIRDSDLHWVDGESLASTEYVHVSFPLHLGVTRMPHYDKAFVDRIHSSSSSNKEAVPALLENPEYIGFQDNGAAGIRGWPGLCQNGEDLYAFDSWFFGIMDGVILESGALNGLQYSNSWFFERFANWTVVNVEADPYNYAALTKNRPDAVNIHAALCSSSTKLHYVQVEQAISGIWEFMDDNYKQKFYPELYENPANVGSLPEISCVPPKLLFASLDLKRIDMWVLDVEGAELDVLKGVDWEQVDIKSIIMECDGTDIVRDEAKRTLVTERGFECLQVGINCMCKHKTLNTSTGGAFDGYPYSVIKGGRGLFTMIEGVVRPFATMDNYNHFQENCPEKRARERKEVTRTYHTHHPMGPPLGMEEIDKYCLSATATAATAN